MYQKIQNTLKRFVYFELYFDDKALGVLMRKSVFNESNQSFPPFDLDRREWAEAKQQMRMWSHYLRAETEEISELSSYGESFIGQLRKSKNTPISKSDEAYVQTIDYIFSTPCFWPIIAYIGIIRLNPLLSPQQLPTFTLNLIQSTMPPAEFAQIMRKQLTLFPVLQRELWDADIMVVDQFKLAAYEKDDAPAIPDMLSLLLFPYANANATSDCAKALNEFANARNQNDNTTFPLQTVPFLLGSGPVANSAFLSLSVEAKEFSQLVYDDANANVFANLNTIFMQELPLFLPKSNRDDDADDTRDMLKEMKKNLKNRHQQFDDYWNGLSKKFKYIPKEYFYLARWLAVFLDAKGAANKTKHQPLFYQKLEGSLSPLNDLYGSRYNSVDSFLKHILSMRDSYPSVKPATAEAFNASSVPFHLDVTGQKLILYPPELLQKALSTACPSIAAEDAIKLLSQRGLLKTNKAEGDLTYNWSIDKRAVRTYAILVDSVNFETKSSITMPVIEEIKKKQKKSSKKKKR